MALNLPLIRVQLWLRALDPVRFADYSGSAWRGLFGLALKRTVCVTRERRCEQCPLYRACVYAYIFETPPPLDTQRLRGASAAPHPFVLRPDFALRTLEPGQVTALHLTLIGRAIAHLPYIIFAMQRAGEIGLGKAESRFELVDIHQETAIGNDDWRSIWDGHSLTTLPSALAPNGPPPALANLRFHTPIRLKHGEHLLGAERFELQGLIFNLARRVYSLSYFHDDARLEDDLRPLAAQAGDVRALARELRWYDWTRYSNRQQSRMQMGGLLGSVTYAGADLEPYWPLLWLGQWIHVGKATSMGLGYYTIDAASLPEPQTQVA